MKGILNENTEIIHKYEQGTVRGLQTVRDEQGERIEIQTLCGAASTVPSDQLRAIPIEQAVVDADVSKCGRCFDEGNGY